MTKEAITPELFQRVLRGAAEIITAAVVLVVPVACATADSVSDQSVPAVEPLELENSVSQESLPMVGDFSELDARVRALPVANSIDEVAKQLSELATDEWEKTRAIYIWLTDNIAYDAEAYFAGRRAVTDPESVISVGKSVCQGYANLFTAIGRRLGLEVETISGYAKGYSYAEGKQFSGTNHAWNAVVLDGQRRFFDATWAAGHVSSEGFVKDFGEFWFDPEPALFLYSHLAADSNQQPAGFHMTLDEFVGLPYIASHQFESLCDLGFSDQQVLATLEAGGSLVTSYRFSDYEIAVEEAPVTRVLDHANEVAVRIRAPSITEAAFISNGEFFYLTRQGDVFVGSIRPNKGRLKVSLKLNYRNQTSFWGLLEYQVE